MVYFFIKSRMNGMVLDVEGGNPEPGTYVITWDKKEHSMENVNQIFYDHLDTGTIRSAVNDYCLDVNGDNEIVLQPYRPGDSCQRWRIDGEVIRNEDGQVIDISGEKDEGGARLCKWSQHGKTNQHWEFEYIEDPHSPTHPSSFPSSSSSSDEEGGNEKNAESEPRYFYIRSLMHGKVLDVEGGDTNPGAALIMWPKKDDPEDNQLYTFGPNGVIKSKLNGYVIDSRDGELTLQPQDGSPHQSFRRAGECLANRADGRFFDISGGSEEDGARVCLWDDHGGMNQRWELDYVD